MSIFAAIDSEATVQALDKTRLIASRSFIAATTALTSVEIKPSKLGSFVHVDTDLTTPDSWYLDWQYPFKIEIDALNNKLDFSESGSAKVATLTTGAYTLAALATEIGLKMTAAGTQTYTASVSSANKFTISAGTVFSLLVYSGTNASVSVFPDLWMYISGTTTENLTAAATYTGPTVEYVNITATSQVKNATDSTGQTATRTIKVISEYSDQLWATDDDLRRHEFDIMNYLPDGRNTFKHVHRRVQEAILEFYDREGYVDAFDLKMTKNNFLQPAEMNEWAKYYALKLIYESIYTKDNDFFVQKARHYGKLADMAKDRVVLRVDVNDDGQIDKGEQEDVRSCAIIRR